MLDQFLQNILGVDELISSPTNKVQSDGNQNPEGTSGDMVDVLDLPMSDEELLKLRDDWEKAYAPYEGKIKEIPKRNLRSYLGRMKDGTVPGDDAIVAANLQFESEETFLPAATAQDPSPYVFANNTQEGNAISKTVQTMLEYHAQQLLLRRKLAVMVRQWSIHHLGVLKPGWDMKINDVAIENRKIQDFIFDPDGYVDVYGDFIGHLGERIKVTAQKLIDLFPKHEEYIKLQVMREDGPALGTEVTYTEWWNDDYCFTTFKDKVLDKHKNEYFNYPEKLEGDFLDENGEPLMTEPRNHFAVPKKPYIFLSVFSLQEHPHDMTGLIEQNIPNQNAISRQTAQIDFNVDASNNGYAYSENNFNQETGKQAAEARKAGRPILIPAGGPIGEAILPMPATPLPTSFFDSVEMHKNDLRSSWGTQGISSQPAKPDETARGMVLNQGRDTSRIGGGIVDVLEQSVAKACFDWLVQLYEVFYDEKHFGVVMGTGKAVQYAELSKKDINVQLIVGVSPNSMKPKDKITEMNQAQELYKAGAIGPKILLETLDFPNSDDAAADGVLWQVDKMSYIRMNFPEMFQQLQQAAQEQMQAQQQQVQAQQEQEAQAVAQQQAMESQSHEQKMVQDEQLHEQKMRHGEDMASAKLAQTKTAVPK